MRNQQFCDLHLNSAVHDAGFRIAPARIDRTRTIAANVIPNRNDNADFVSMLATNGVTRESVSAQYRRTQSAMNSRLSFRYDPDTDELTCHHWPTNSIRWFDQNISLPYSDDVISMQRDGDDLHMILYTNSITDDAERESVRSTVLDLIANAERQANGSRAEQLLDTEADIERYPSIEQCLVITVPPPHGCSYAANDSAHHWTDGIVVLDRRDESPGTITITPRTDIEPSGQIRTRWHADHRGTDVAEVITILDKISLHGWRDNDNRLCLPVTWHMTEQTEPRKAFDYTR